MVLADRQARQNQPEKSSTSTQSSPPTTTISGAPMSSAGASAGDSQRADAADMTPAAPIDGAPVDGAPGQLATSRMPAFIQTWPLDEGANSDAETENQMPALVRRWPGWLQQQWRQAEQRRRWQARRPVTATMLLFSPLGTLLIAAMLVLALVGYGIGAAVNRSNAGPATSSSSASTSSMPMGSSSSSAASAHVPDATQQYGNQPAKYVLDPNGVKHFTLTAEQVMWQPIKGQRVLAWTLDGTVPGPLIHVTAGDHVRITIINHLPEATAIHWHGLEVPTNADGVPPLGMKPIQPGQSYTYDFTLQDQDAGTHWYHSHYDDLTQMGGGLYGAFLVDPRPGSPEYPLMQPMLSAQVDHLMLVGMLGDYYVINGKSFPETQPIVVKHGQTVHVRMIGVDANLMHPMHLHGSSFQIVAEDGHMLSSPITKDTVQVAPGETYDLTFYGWAAPGSVYPFHCHILSHLMNPGQQSGEMGGLIVLVKYTA